MGDGKQAAAAATADTPSYWWLIGNKGLYSRYNPYVVYSFIPS